MSSAEGPELLTTLKHAAQKVPLVLRQLCSRLIHKDITIAGDLCPPEGTHKKKTCSNAFFPYILNCCVEKYNYSPDGLNILNFFRGATSLPGAAKHHFFYHFLCCKVENETFVQLFIIELFIDLTTAILNSDHVVVTSQSRVHQQINRNSRSLRCVPTNLRRLWGLGPSACCLLQYAICRPLSQPMGYPLFGYNTTTPSYSIYVIAQHCIVNL